MIDNFMVTKIFKNKKDATIFIDYMLHYQAVS